jgi:opacity protein-like surface antigen
MRTRLMTALLIPCLAMAQDKSRELEEQLSRRDSNSKTDVRATFLLGMAQVTDAQTKKDLASSGQGAALGIELDFPLHNHLVLGARIGGVWLRERNIDYTFLPGASVNSQTKGFEAGCAAKYFFLDADANTGPYAVGVAQWVRWKKYLGLDYQGTNIGDGESLDKTSFAPSVGAGWQFTRNLGFDVRYTRTSFREEYSYVPGYSRDWNLDHLTFSAVFRFGGR